MAPSHLFRLLTSSAVLLGFSSFASGALNRTNVTGWGGASIWVGYAAPSGSVTVNGGTQYAGPEKTIYLAYNATENATINVTGRDAALNPSRWTVTSLQALAGWSTINVTDYGELLAGSLFSSGTTTASKLDVKVNTGGLLTASTFSMGGSAGNSSLAVLSGGRVTGSVLTLGSSAQNNTTTALFDGAGTSGTFSSQINVNGNTNVTVSNGAQLTSGSQVPANTMGSGAGKTATLTVSGAGSLFATASRLDLAASGSTGIITLTDGGKLRVGTPSLATSNPFVYMGSSTAGSVSRIRIGDGGAPGYLDTTMLRGRTNLNNFLEFNHNSTGYNFLNDAGEVIGIDLNVTVKYLSGTTLIGNGIQTGSSYISYTGGTTIANGATLVALDFTGNGRFSSSSATGSGDTTIEAGGTLQIGNGGDRGSPAEGKTLYNSGTVIFNRTDYQTSAKLSGSGTYRFEGPGAITLTGANDYTGDTILKSGAVKISNGASLGVGGLISFEGGTLDYSSYYSGVDTWADLSPRFNTAAGQQYKVFLGGGPKTWNANLTSAGGSLTVSATGQNERLYLNGHNTYSGGTTITNARIYIAHADAFGTGAVSIGGNLGSYLEFTTVGVAHTVANPFILTGDLNLQGPNPYGSVVFAGGITNQADYTRLTLNADTTINGLVLGTGTAANTFHLTALGTTTFSGAIVDGGTGPGTFGIGVDTPVYPGASATINLSGVNTHSGATQIRTGKTDYASLTVNVNAGASLSGPTASLSIDSGTLNLNNAAQTVGTLSGAGTTAKINFGTGHTFTTASSANSSFAGILAGAGAFTKAGGGTLTLSGANTYSGATVINGGRLALAATGSLGNTSGIRVDPGATFDVSALPSFTLGAGKSIRGSGTVEGAFVVDSGARLIPGNSAGTLTFAHGLTLNNGAILEFELGSASDLVRVSGGTLKGPAGTGGLTLNLTDAGGFAENTYVLFDFSGAALDGFEATDFVLGSSIAGYDYRFELSGSTLSLIATSAIPEPSAYAALAGFGALCLVIYRRRRIA